MSTVETAVIALLDCTRDGQVQPSGAAVAYVERLEVSAQALALDAGSGDVPE